MTIDVHVKRLDEIFPEEIDEIMEDTMVQLFVVHPATEQEIESVQQEAMRHNGIYYTMPYRLRELSAQKCIGYKIGPDDRIDPDIPEQKAIFVDESDLTPQLEAQLREASLQGIILNPTRIHPKLKHFLLSFGSETLEHFDAEAVASLTMDALVLESGYPDHGFTSLYDTAKKISDIMFRPEQSIIARSTQSALKLFGLRQRPGGRT